MRVVPGLLPSAKLRVLWQGDAAMNEGPSALICTRLGDMTVMHPEQVEKICTKCGHVVGVYPTGQRAIRDYPDMKVVCSVCVDPFEEGAESYSVGSIDEIVRETHESKPVGKA